MIYGTAFPLYNQPSRQVWTKQIANTFPKAFFQLYPTCGWFLASVMKLKNWIIIPTRPPNHFLWTLLSSKHLWSLLPVPGDPGALIRNLRRKGWIEIISGWKGQRLSIKLASMGKEGNRRVFSYLITIRIIHNNSVYQCGASRKGSH